VLVTGSLDFIIAPLAEELGVADILAASLIESHGRFTGQLTAEPLCDQEKARRVRTFAEQNGIDLSRSYAYGDSIADLAMLEAVGHPQAVNPDRALAAVARARGWPVLRWKARGGSGHDLE
jgi:HAD superfamily hydrolase (TIGR01490 family)